MQEGFDPYRKWLGIPPAEQPPNHYRLLGVPLFEDDSETISHAADQRMTYVRTLAVGDHIEATQKLLNELATAKVCLLNPDKKAAYDRQLRLPEAAASPPRALVPPGSTVAQRRPTVPPPVPSARAPRPAPMVPPKRAAEVDPLPLPLMPDLPPNSGVPASRIRPLPSATRRPKRGPTPRSSAQPLLPWAAVAGLLAVIVLVTVGVVTAFRNQGAGEVVNSDQGQINSQPPENHPPSIKVVSVEPQMPEAGGSLTIRLTGRDPEDDAIAFEYRTGPNSPWQIATDGRVTLSGLQAGILNLEIRARDSAAHVSEVKTLTKEIFAAAPPLAVAPFSADQAKRYQETWAKHLVAKVEIENSLGMKLRFIPPGEFMMGSPQVEIDAVVETHDPWHGWFRSEGPRHPVKVTQAFYLGSCEVTQRQYEDLMGVNPSHFSPTGPGKDAVKDLDTSQFPVEMVSWFDAVDFCNKLSEKEQRLPYYAHDGDGVTILGGTGYRLPTEAEWEYASRAGTTTRWFFGDNETNLSQHAWFSFSAGGRTHRVEGLLANPFGLYDLYGNVWEWCSDWYGEYAAGEVSDPTGPTAGSARVVRGGTHFFDALHCRSALRYADHPMERYHSSGFRVFCGR